MKMDFSARVISSLIIIILIGENGANNCPDYDEYTLLYPCVIQSQLAPPKKLPSNYNPPKLDIVNRSQDIKANDTFEVECFGNKPLEWRIYQAQNDIGERINITETVNMENEDFQFSSKLFLFDAQYADTSYYGCFYNGTKVDNSLSTPQTMASFYLYVNDDDHLFVPVPLITKGFNSPALVIPCRPTNSRVNVTLWRRKGIWEHIDLEEDRVEFDPTRGFSIYNPAHLEHSLFECRGALGEVEETVDTFVTITTLRIENEAKFYTVDKEYKLACVVDGYPNTAIWFERRQCDPCTSNDDWEKLDDTNSSENKELMSEIDKSVSYEVRRSLTLIAKQSGEYRCVVQNRWGTGYQDIMFSVSDIDDGFALIPAKERPMQGDNVTICCKANKIYYSNLTWYAVTLEGERHSLPLDAKVTALETRYSYELYLTFPKIGEDFSKNFTCVTKDIDGNETESVRYLLSVETAPKFLSISETKFYLKNSARASLDCTATGFPFPNISWSKDGKAIPEYAAVFETTDKGWILRIKEAIKPLVEGTYECVVMNRNGLATRTFEVFVVEKISTVLISMFVCLPVLVIALCIVCFCFVRQIRSGRREKAELEALSRELFGKGEVHLLNPDSPLDDQVELLPYDPKWEFPKNRLKLGRILGQGAFGRVVESQAIGLDEEGTSTVAVKMLKERADKTQLKALMVELKILIHLGKHLNIVNLLGAVTTNVKKGELWVIVEYCRYGNLRNYLLKRKGNFINQLCPETGQIDPNLVVLPPGSPFEAQLAANPVSGQNKANYVDFTRNESPSSERSDDVATTVPNSPNTAASLNEDDEILQPLSTCDLLCYAFQVARGMQYLSSRKLLHRDLAARNVLLADDNVVKICDFGLAKDCYKCDNYKIQGNGPLPIKWMALESLEQRVFTTKSDIWSYGILLWEFFTLGGDPYPGMDLDEDFYKRLKSGYRMEKPEYAPDNAYRVMLQCWDETPDHRPSFEDLGDTFGDLLHAGAKNFYLKLDSQYAEMNALNKGTDYITMNKSAFLSMGKEESEREHVDHVNSIRPVDNSPVTREPTEVIPPIQLEAVNAKRHESKGRAAPGEPVTDTGYLLMNKYVFSGQREGNESPRYDSSS